MKAGEGEKRRTRILEAFRTEGTIRGTAKKLHMGVNTVRKALRGQQLGRGAPQHGAPARPSKLDPYRQIIQRLVLEDKLTAVLVHAEISALGYTGGHTILKQYVRQIRPQSLPKPTTVVEHVPGDEGQVDWSPYTVELGGEVRVVHGFSMVLPWSRYMVVRFALDEQLETLVQMHEEAFLDIGAIPHVMTYDNMTTVGRHVGPGQVWINPRFEAYAKERGFEIKLIKPGNPNEHASVERPFGYVEGNCLLRRRSRFASLDDLQAHARWWCAQVANVRDHGTTRERPIDRLVREKPLMLPLASGRVELCRTLARLVGSDFCVAVDTSRYSVPPRFVGQPCTVRLYEAKLEILIGGEIVAVHERHHEPRGRHVLPEHEEQFKRCTPSRRLLEQAFLRLGSVARDYHQGLVAERGKGAGYHIQRILKLADRHGSSVVIGAMSQAARYGNYSADAVARVVAGRAIKMRNKAARGHGAEPPPEAVRRWLEGLDVEQRDLDDYDRMLDDKEPGDDTEDDDGQE